MSGTTGLTVDVFTATIPAGQALSAAIPLDGRTPLWITTPATLSGTVLTFVAVSPDDGELPVRDTTGAEVTLLLGAAGARHSLLPAIGAALAGTRHLRIRAGTGASPAAQAAERTLRLGARMVL